MSKEKDMPLRVWESNIALMNEIISKKAVQVPSKKNKKRMKTEKMTFNELLRECINAYQMFKDAQVFYANELYTDLAEARGQAILKATRTKTPIHLPTKVCVVGKDEL